jgi:hypothetical protein
MENLTKEQFDFIALRLQFLDDCLQFIKKNKTTNFNVSVQMEEKETLSEINLIAEIFGVKF